MANILIVSGAYFPYATANTVCAKYFEDALKKQGHKVFYAVKQNNINQMPVENADGTVIHNVPKTVELYYNTMNSCFNLDLPSFMKQAHKAGYTLSKALTKLSRVFKRESFRDYSERIFFERYVDTVEKIIVEENIDMVLSVSMPFMSHNVVLKVRERLSGKADFKWVAYCIDSYSGKRGISPSDSANKLNEELEVFSAVDKILLLKEIEKDYKTEPFKSFLHKMSVLPLPLFDLSKPIDDYDSVFDESEDGLKLVFTGTLYDDSSNLEYFVKFFSKVKGDIRIYFMGKIYPKNIKRLDELKSVMGERLKVYGRMPYEFAQASIKNADALINIGNLNTNQVPSKIFEYMKCGVPIITFYRVPDDTGIPYLEKYPLAYNIFEDEDSLSDESINRFNEFLNSSVNKHVTLDELRELYSDISSETVCNSFTDMVNAILKKEEQ